MLMNKGRTPSKLRLRQAGQKTDPGDCWALSYYYDTAICVGLLDNAEVTNKTSINGRESIYWGGSYCENNCLTKQPNHNLKGWVRCSRCGWTKYFKFDDVFQK